MTWTVPFRDLDAKSLAVAGGKAANLGELTRAGFPVPPGFCVTTGAYAAAVVGLDDLVAAMEASAEPEQLAGQARELVLSRPIPEAIAAAVKAAYRALGPEAPGDEAPGAVVAVRSSATAEDLPTASFAGQQDTYLGLQGEDAVLDAVRRCWASLWTDRAVSYRARQGIGQRHVKLAVAVQVMVDAEVAGVLFTANPLTGRRGEAVLDASYGLGEAIVSGLVNPDHWVIGQAIRERHLGDKHLAVRLAPGGTRHEELPDGSDHPCLTDDQLHEAAALGKRVEAHYGRPQDLELAFAGGRLWLLQARAITTLYPLPPKQGDDLRVYLSVNVAQGVLQPFTPMGAQAFKLVSAAVAGLAGYPVADPAQGAPVLAEAGDRLFLDLTTPLRTPLGRRLADLALSHLEDRAARTLRHLVHDEPALRLDDVPERRTAGVLLRAALRTGIPQRVAAALHDPDAARRRALAATPAIAALGHADGTVESVERFFAGATFLFREVAPATLGGLASLALAARVLEGLCTRAELQIVRRALPHNPTTEMDDALWHLARAIAAAPDARAAVEAWPPERLVEAYHAGTLPPAIQAPLGAFLGTYGHRALPEIDLGIPRWREDPGFLFGALRNLLRHDDPAQAPDAQFARARAEAEAMAATLVGRARQQGWLHGKLAAFALDRLRRLMGLRESLKFNLVAFLARGRELLLAVGEAQVKAGRLDHADDVFFLTLPELRAGGDLRALVAEHRASYQQERQRRQIPRVLLSDGRTPSYDPPPGADGALQGSGASPGAVTARARVVLDPLGAHLEPGEILVAPSTDPGWTPLFLAAGGLVMEMGGAMSHGAVVAREYGIPAVVGVPRATELIKTGQTLLVDGLHGLVVPQKPLPSEGSTE